MIKKIIPTILFAFLLITSSCDAPSPFTWKGDYKRDNDVYNLSSTVVGSLTATASPDNVSSIDERVVITATVTNMIGLPMQGVDVTFRTDTGFFRSEEFGPSEIFTTKSDSEGKAYAHLLQVGRTCTIEVEAGGLIVHVVVAFN
jgi:hypothetical protein